MRAFRLPRIVSVMVFALLLALLVAAFAAGGTVAGNRRAAERDALRLLSMVRLPAGARPVGRETVSTDRGSHPVDGLVASSAQAVGRASWLVPASQDAVLGYVEAHRPPDASIESTGSSSGPGGGAEMVTFSLPAIPGVIDLRELTVSVSADGSARSRVSVESASVWLVPRAASERAPPATREIDATLAHLNGPTIATHRITGALVAAVVSRFDALDVVQPFVTNCPAEIGAGARVVTLPFGAGPGSPALAQATFTAFPGWSTSSNECAPIRFTIDGRSEPPLLGGDFFGWLGKELHTSFAAPRPAGTDAP